MLIGNGAMMVRTFPHGAVQFLSYEQYKQFLDSLCGKGALSHLLAGSLAGIPLVIKCRRNDGLKFTLSEFKLILVDKRKVSLRWVYWPKYHIRETSPSMRFKEILKNSMA